MGRATQRMECFGGDEGKRGVSVSLSSSGEGERQKRDKTHLSNFRGKACPDQDGPIHPSLADFLQVWEWTDCRTGELYDFLNKGFHRVGVFH